MMKSNHSHSSPLPTCLRPPTTTSNHHSTTVAPPPTASTSPNLTTSIYHTQLGLFALTWSRSPLLGRSLHLHLLLNNNNHPNPTLSPPSSLSSPPSFHLHIKPFIFWNKQGSKKLKLTKTVIHVFWDLTKAKFGSRPEPQSGYYIAAVVDGDMTLLAGDLPTEAYAKTRAQPHNSPEKYSQQLCVLRREHVYGNKLYTTKADFGGKTRDISIDFSRGAGDDSRLCFSVDTKRVLKIKHLKWKFRGNERVEVDGVHVNVSWDVYNWLFEEDENGFALFTFRFDEESQRDHHLNLSERNGGAFWSQQSDCGFGFEKKKMKKSLLRGTRTRSSSSSSSLSSASSGCGSVMEWESVEENELKDPSGFSLLVYAWKR